MIAEVFVLLSEVLLYNVLTKVNKGEIDFTDISYVTSVEYVQIAINAIAIVIYVISCITFIQWFRRAYYNLGQIAKNLSYEEGWAAGSWFVPILNYFRPYQIMKELYKKTKKNFTTIKSHDQNQPANPIPKPMVGILGGE